MSSNGSSTPVIGVEEQVTDELVVKSGDVSKDTDDPGTPVSDAVHGDTPGEELVVGLNEARGNGRQRLDEKH